MASDRLTLRLPKSFLIELKDLGELTGRTESDLAREAIEHYLIRYQQLPNCHEIAKQMGLIGCVETKNRDLSTVVNDMRGFGE